MENYLNCRTLPVDELLTQKPFEGLFPIDDKVLFAIKESIEINGYDMSKPVDVWNNIVIDGHTRLLAAKQAGITEILVFPHDFTDEDEALEYAIHNQRDRRNMTDADILRCVKMLDKRKIAGRPPEDKLAQSCANLDKGKSVEKTAEIVGVSPRKVEQTRTILDHADAKTKQEVFSGKKSINKAYNETQERRKQETAIKSKSTFNLTNENIEWAKWTWNPVTGCKHGCEYCYARDIANRFYSEKFEPTFRPERLEAPFNTKIPTNPLTKGVGIHNVFVCSMADLFGDWVPKEWITQVLEVCHNTPQWTYIFLTKNPKRYLENFFDDKPNFSDNCWVGATADTQKRMTDALSVFYELEERGNNPKIAFVSCEPLLESISFYTLPAFLKDDEPVCVDWLIIGGRSKSSQLPAFQPEWEWVEDLLYEARENGIKVYFKPNLTVTPKEFPL